MSATKQALTSDAEKTVAVSLPWPGRSPSARIGGLPRAALPLSGRWIQVLYVLADVFFISTSATVMLAIRFFPETIAVGRSGWLEQLAVQIPLRFYAGCLLIYAALTVFACQSQGLYRTVRGRAKWDESFAVSKAVVLATALLTAFLYLAGDNSISRLVIVFSGLMNIATLTAWRIWKRQLIEHRVSRGIGVRNVLIVGAGRVGQAMARYLETNKHLGFAVKGFLDQNHHGESRLLGRIEDLPTIARTHYADEVFITIPSERALVKRVALMAREQRLEVKVVPDMYDGLGWNAPIRFVGDYPVMELHREPIPALGLFFKRLLDILGSTLALVCLFPAMAMIAFLVRLDSSGPAIYRSRRVGKKGREFTCYKFRTMVANADALKEELRGRNQRNGPFFKLAEDPRVTRLGRFLRKYSLDELPQFWNVLKGSMSLVGPRPHPLDDYERYSLEDRRRLDVKPGITGLWQVTARRDPSFETNMVLDLQYIERWTLALDLLILLRTAVVVLRGQGQ